MADSTLAVKYSDLRSIIGTKAYGKGAPADFTADEGASVERVMASGLRSVYYPHTLGEKYAHEWSFLRPISALHTTAPYETGTVEIAAGVVTLTGGTWPTWSTQGELLVNGQPYAIASRDSNSQLTLEDASVTVTAGATFVLGRQAYDLPDDYAGLEEGFTYRPGTSACHGEVILVGEHDIRSTPWTGRAGRPSRCAVVPKAIVSGQGQRWKVLLDPPADREYTLHYRYRIDPDKLSSDEYPYGGVALAGVIVEACLASFERLYDDAEGIHCRNFLPMLATAISHDRMANSAPSLGYDGAGQLDDGAMLRAKRTDWTTYNGQLPWPLEQ